MFGVIAGGVATWFGQHCWRRAAGSMRRTRAMPAAELADLRERLAASRNGGNQVPASRLQPPALTPSYLAIGRDKHGAAL